MMNSVLEILTGSEITSSEIRNSGETYVLICTLVVALFSTARHSMFISTARHSVAQHQTTQSRMAHKCDSRSRDDEPAAAPP